MKPELKVETSEVAKLGMMSFQAGVEGEGKPMVIKKAEPKPEIKGRVLPVTERKKPKRAAGDSIF